MTKKRRFLTSLLLALVTFSMTLFTACANDGGNNDGSGSGSGSESESSGTDITTDSTDVSDEVKVEDVEYLQTKASPDYAEITAENQAKYTTYYFAANGDDANAGTSESAPLRSVTKANEIIANAGEKPTKIAFKAGDSFHCEYVKGDAYKKGQLYVAGHSAKEETPLLVTTYGEGDYAKITAPSYSETNQTTAIVYIGDSNARVFNLELTGEKNRTAVQIYSTQGIYTKKGGAMKNVVLSNCWMHDIYVNYTENENVKIREAYAEALEKQKQGVFDYMPDPETDFDNDQNTKDDVQSIVSDDAFRYGSGGVSMGTATAEVNGPTWFENVWIEDNKIERVARCGMFLSAGWARRPGWDNGSGSYYYDEATGEEYGYYPNKNISVRDNYTDYTAGDGIVLLNSHDSYVERNVSYHAQYLGRSSSTNSQAGYSVPIWIHSCDNVIMQYNEAAYCYMVNGALDAQGFDIDIGNRNIIFRYNYSHHNAGGGLLITNRSTSDSVYDANGNKVTESSWYDMNGNLVEADDDNNKGIPLVEKRYILIENIYVHNNVFAYNDIRTFDIAGPTKNLQICNNTVLLDGKERPRGSEYKILQSGDMGKTGTRAVDWLFANNIFYQLEKQPVKFDESFCDSCTITNNVFYNFEDSFFEFGLGSNHLASTKFANYSRTNPELATTDAALGFENALKITASASYLKELASYVEVMQATDMSGADATGKAYMGAFLNN